jgi:hypothetical protein
MAPNNPGQTAQHGRKTPGSQPRRKVLILCEDSKSSCFYFRAFPIDPKRVQVLTIGTGANTDSLVEDAIQRKTEACRRHEPFNEVWCVFDRDSFPVQNYHRAFELARANRIRIAWTNEAFELWYLLHFNYHDTAISRNAYSTKLLPHFNYDKADDTIYHKVIARQEIALHNARRLEKYWNESGERHPERQNPSTSMHRLVEFLNALAELGPVE